MSNKKVACEPCNGTGLADEHNLCIVCKGNGKVPLTVAPESTDTVVDTNPGGVPVQNVQSIFNEVPDGGNPTGGQTILANSYINWQDGLLVDGLKNGAFVEDVITAAIQRLEYFQESKFNCQENADAITALQDALSALESRTKSRVDQGVKNTYTPHQ